MSIRRIHTGLFLAFCTVACWPAGASADEPTTSTTVPADPQLGPIITHFRLWLFGLLFGGATLMLTIAGGLYMLAAGNPTQIERAKTAFKSALVGYAVAALAPVLVTVLKGLTA